jgi:hypothetical protein
VCFHAAPGIPSRSGLDSGASPPTARCLDAFMLALRSCALLPLSLLCALLPAASHAAEPRLCVFDMLGTAGDVYNASKDYAAAMQRVGVSLQLKVYTDERIAVDDFRTSQCDAILATAFRTRAFNAVTASTDAFGAALIVRDGRVDRQASNEVIRMASQVFAAPNARSLVVQGKYEMAGLIAVGSVYSLVKDRKVNTLDTLAARRMMALDQDKAQAYLIQKAGAQPVATDLGSFANKFKLGMVDMAAAPALAFKPLDLMQSLGSQGAVCTFPNLNMSFQLIVDRDKFPPGFADTSRKYWLRTFDEVLARINKAEADVPAQAWMELSADNTQRYANFLRDTRIELAELGVYNKPGLKVLKRIRCKVNPSDPECAMPTEFNW